MKEPFVYILVLNWKSLSDTIACVESIQKLDYSNYKVMLIDNNSPDGSGAAIQKRLPQHEYLQTGRNLGYAGGNNLGIRRAIKNGAEFIWILNPDVRVHADSLKIMIGAMQKDNTVGVCAPRIQFQTAHNIKWIDGSCYVPDRFEPIKQSVKGPSEIRPPVIEVSDVWGCSMLIRKEVLQQIGLIREDFFLYLEETDFNFRARSQNWKIIVCTKAMNIHLRLRAQTFRDEFYYRRNELLLARIHKRYFGTAILWSLGLEKVGPYLKKKKFRAALWHLMRMNLIACLAGCFTLIKPIPRL